MGRVAASAALLLALAAPSSAGPWRLRAREHFETGKLNLADGQGDMGYRGFLSAFDLFHEKPYDLSYGLTVQRGRLGRVRRNDSVTVTAVGAEVKHFPVKRTPWFWRGGVQTTGIDPADMGGDFWTYGFTLGTGFEFPLARLGVAPEVGGRFDWGTHGKRLTDLYVALGVHFYVFKGDPKPGRALREER